MNDKKLFSALTLTGLMLLTGRICVADEVLYSDDFESGQKAEWTYYADPSSTSVTEINEARYKETPTHSLYIKNLEGNYWGQDNGIAYAELDISGLSLTIPYTIEVWVYATESTYSPDYNHFSILTGYNDIHVFLYDDYDGIHISDGTGWHEFLPSEVLFEFQTWVKVKYTRASIDSYVLQVGDWIHTGQPHDDSVSTTLMFGDYRYEFGKGAASWDDLLISLPECNVIPTTLHFGNVWIGSYLDKAFVITNTGAEVLTGDVAESCDHYSIVSGGGAYSLDPGEWVEVTVRFEPESLGQHNCAIETGNGLCSDVSCVGFAGTGGVPALSGWSLILTALLLLTTGTIAFRRRVGVVQRA